MICQFCGKSFGRPFIAHAIRDYFLHLIGSHWDLLVRIHNAIESGELPRT